jgi:hypothetical protein
MSTGGFSMLRLLLLAVLFVSPVFAQDTQPSALTGTGCGADTVHFDVKTDKKHHPTAQPEPGKALVYVIGDSNADHVAIHVGAPPTRFGVDGTWVGANGFRTYFFFPVDPGEHRLCTEEQTIVKRANKSSIAATSFTAEAGQSYYFKTKTPDRPVPGEELKLVAVDPAEAQVLIEATAYSTSALKK